jgi:ABC-type nickel/cobalt efflux system permease component RcnA
MITVLTGFVAGAAHVWTGPDHLAALAPLAADQPSRAWIPGARWGAGHSLGVVAIGLLALLFREALPMELLSSWSERLVGVMLFAIGLWAVCKAARLKIHTHQHEHAHESGKHIHIHAHSPGHDHAAPSSHRHTHAAVGIGLLHGLAGSAHFFGVLPMLALPTRSQALLYLLTFSLGTIASMAAFSWFVGLTASRCAGRGPQLYRGFIGLCGLAAMIVGGFWLLQGH